MGNTGIRGTQIRDETIESQDLASGSIKMGELNTDVIRSQDTIGTVDTSNDFLLIYDADAAALKKVAPTNLGVGGSGSPGGSDTQVQYNNGGSFGGAAQLIYDDSNHRLGVGSTSAPDYTLDVAGNIGADEYIYHNGDADTFMRFQDDSINFQAGGADFITITEAAQDEVVINENSTDIDLRVESNHNTHFFYTDGANSRIGIGTNSPQSVIHIVDPFDSYSGSERDAVIIMKSKKETGIKLIADSGNDNSGGENNNPFVDFYQDGQSDTSGRGQRNGSIAMEGDAATTFTGSLANAFFMDAHVPNSPHSSRPFQLANDSINGGHKARITFDGTNGYVGLHTSTPSSPVHAFGDVSGTPVVLIDNDNSSSGHGLKVTSDGTGTGTNLLDVESASTTHFRVRGDGRVGIGKVSSLPAAVLTVSSSNTDSDIAIAHKIHHIGDSDTSISFADDEISLVAGGRTFIKIEEASTDKLTINNGGLDIDLKVSGENYPNLIRTDAENDRVGIGTSSPDGILHIDNGTSNTEVIIEKDAGTSGSIVFHNAGTREAHIAYSTGEDLEVTHQVSNKDIIFNFVSGSTAVEPLRLDADVGAAKIGKHFGRTPSTALDLGSGTSSTVDPTESVMIINAASITAAANNMHTMTIIDGKFSGQTVTFIFDRDFLDGDGGASDMGAVVTGGTFLGSHVLSVIGSAMSGKSAAGASFTIAWTGSAWGVISQNGLTQYP